MEKINSKSDMNLNTFKQEVPVGQQGSAQSDDDDLHFTNENRWNSQENKKQHKYFRPRIKVCQIQLFYRDGQGQTTSYCSSGSLFRVVRWYTELLGIVITTAHGFVQEGKLTYGNIEFYDSNKDMKYTCKLIKVLLPAEYRQCCLGANKDHRFEFDYAFAIIYLHSKYRFEFDSYFKFDGWKVDVEGLYSHNSQVFQKENKDVKIFSTLKLDKKESKIYGHIRAQNGIAIYQGKQDKSNSYPNSQKGKLIHYKVLNKQFNASDCKGQCGSVVGFNLNSDNNFHPVGIQCGHLENNISVARVIDQEILDFSYRVERKLKKDFLHFITPLFQALVFEWKAINDGSQEETMVTEDEILHLNLYLEKQKNKRRKLQEGTAMAGPSLSREATNKGNSYNKHKKNEDQDKISS